MVTFLKTHLAWIWSSYTLTEAAFLEHSELNSLCGILRCLVLNDPYSVNSFKVHALKATSLVLNLSNGNWLLSWQCCQSNRKTWILKVIDYMYKYVNHLRQKHICRDTDEAVPFNIWKKMQFWRVFPPLSASLWNPFWEFKTCGRESSLV